jgi:hypothetical protein
MIASDFVGLPQKTQEFVRKVHQLGLDRTRLHGLFVVLGLYAGRPDTEDNIRKLFDNLDAIIPIDRSMALDEIVGNFYYNYNREIEEFCFKTRIPIKLREIEIPKTNKTSHLFNIEDHGLFPDSHAPLESWADYTRFYHAFIAALGAPLASQSVNLVSSYQCGMFYTQIHAQIDPKATWHVVDVIKRFLPPIYDIFVNVLIDNILEHFLGLEPEQVAINSLMPLEPAYGEQMWAFQSSLFYSNGVKIPGISQLDEQEWHGWAIKRARDFDLEYPTELLPFSQSKFEIGKVPTWPTDIAIFENCDQLIKQIRGYSLKTLETPIEKLQYRALIIQAVYSSLTMSRE